MKIKKIILSLIICIGLLFLISPENTFAEVRESANGKGSNCTTAKCKTCANNICKSDFKISIDVSKYSKKAWYNGFHEYVNSSEPRNIKITVPKAALTQNAVYRIRVFYGKYGTLDDSSFINLDKDIDDLDNDDLDDGLKVYKTKIASDSKKLEKKYKAIEVSRDSGDNVVNVKLNPGYDALVVVYLSKDTKTNKKCKNDKGKKFEVSCINGREQTRMADGVMALSGVSASEYIQNPDETIEVKNLRGIDGEYNEACINARDGKYDSKTELGEKIAADDKKYTVPEAERAYYQQHYYDPLLGTFYCNKKSVAFNITEQQIAQLANSAMEMYYKSKKLSKKSESTSGYANTYDEVKKHVTDLQADKNVKTVSNTNVSLQCESDLKQGIGSKQYLYVEDKPIATSEPLSDGSSPTICNTICYEHLTVEYDPPVAAIAGICISYKVTVKSETKCGVKYNKEIIEGSNTNTNGGLVGKLQKEMCSPIPICSGEKNHTQAGPSEDFDKCIKECDNGKYSQSCINKCYKQVYENNKKDVEKNNIEKTSNNDKAIEESELSNLVFEEKNNSNNLLEVKDLHTWDEKNLKGYSSKSTAVGKCDTQNEILNDLDWCSEYFFEAKALYPKGHYNKDGSKWKSDLNCSNYKNKKDIWCALGKASPFYLRDKAATKQLILAVLDKDPHNNATYYIDKDGVKRQYKASTNWHCGEICEYTGCSAKNSLTPDAFVNNLNIAENSDKTTTKSDMKIIADALDSCQVSADCKETEKTADFKIKIINPRDSNTNNEVEKNGKTELGNTNPISENNICDENKKDPPSSHVFSMFVPADSEEPKSKYGILGWCYDGTTQSPQYQTTITFPGTWINDKSLEPEYDSTCKTGSAPHGQTYCFPRDSSNINVAWWHWHEQTKDKDGNLLYPTIQEPTIKNNIQAQALNFGKYNWTINYSCFYGIYDNSSDSDNIPIPPPGDDVGCKNPPCHENQSYKFKVIDQGELFTENSNQKQGYNWTSAAKIVAGIDNNNQYSQTYGIDPQKYVEYLRSEEKDETIYSSTTESDYYIYIPSEGIDYIKNEYKNHKYTDYTGNFKEDPKILGLLRYTSKVIDDLNGKSFKNGSKIIINYASNVRPISNGQGTNNNYKDISKLR